MTSTLVYTPVVEGYTLEPGYSCLEVQLDGGSPLKRADVALYQPHTATVNWVLSFEDFTKFMGFFRTTLKNATQPFLMSLVSDTPLALPHRCRTRNGLPKLSQQRGRSYYVTATIEVEQNPTYTGTITYQEPNEVIFATNFPYLVGPILEDDTIRIMGASGTHPTGPTALNLDGTYSVLGTSGFNTLELDSPASVNSGWTTLASLGAPGIFGDLAHGNVYSTVVRIPT